MLPRTTFVILMSLVLVACDHRDLSEINLIGKNQAYLIETLGEPVKIEELIRNKEHVFGPIEDLWYKVKMGEKS